VEKEKPLVETDIQRLQEELRQAESLLPVDVRENYQRVVRAKGEDALAPIQGEICGGCNQRVLLNMLADLRMSKLVFCKTCGRLLYLPQEIDE
jgi:predicted  nucleic acid-binding Zn-ribbon protein